MLYRVFSWDPSSTPDPLGVPHGRQGTGRHDNPDHYVALYLAREPESAIAERIQAFRGRELIPEDLTRADGGVLSLASLDDGAMPALVDLDDPTVLVGIGRRPSQVATGERRSTQQLALELYLGGAPGIAWWSVLEASWTNVTLFGVRVSGRALPVVDASPLTVEDPALWLAAERLGVRMRAAERGRPGPRP